MFIFAPISLKTKNYFTVNNYFTVIYFVWNKFRRQIFNVNLNTISEYEYDVEMSIRYSVIYFH